MTEATEIPFGYLLPSAILSYLCAIRRISSVDIAYIKCGPVVLRRGDGTTFLAFPHAPARHPRLDVLLELAAQTLNVGGLLADDRRFRVCWLGFGNTSGDGLNTRTIRGLRVAEARRRGSPRLFRGVPFRSRRRVPGIEPAEATSVIHTTSVRKLYAQLVRMEQFCPGV